MYYATGREIIDDMAISCRCIHRASCSADARKIAGLLNAGMNLPEALAELSLISRN